MDIKESLAAALPEMAPERYETLPDIELYMDQLMEYLARRPVTLRGDGRLTGAMVNNYIKSGLLPRAKGKRYSREHIADLSVILRLKQVLSVADAGALLGFVRGDSYDNYYNSFCDCSQAVLAGLQEEIRADKGSVEALALRLALESSVKKAAAEYLISALEKAEE